MMRLPNLNKTMSRTRTEPPIRMLSDENWFCSPNCSWKMFLVQTVDHIFMFPIYISYLIPKETHDMARDVLRLLVRQSWKEKRNRRKRRTH